MDHWTELTTDQALEALSGYHAAQRGIPCPDWAGQFFKDGYALWLATAA